MPDTPIEKKSIFDTPIHPRKAKNGAGNMTGEGVDRVLKKSKWPPKKIALIAVVVLFVAAVAYGFSTTTGGARLNVEQDKLTVSTVEKGAFQEYINITGNVMPRTTVYLDAVEGGRVEEVFLREGAIVKQGDPLLRLSNSDLQLRLLNNEAAVTEQENVLQNMRFQMEQNALNLRQQLVELDYQVVRLAEQYKRYQELYKKKLISTQDYETVRDEYQYYQRRRELTQQSYRQDSLSQQLRLHGMQESISRMRDNFKVLQQTLENLLVRAPVSGHLTMLQAEIGELRTPGSRFGQIDMLDGGYKVRAGIDEFYISRVRTGQTGTTQPIAGKEYRMKVIRVYPEVRDGRFEVDLEFEGDTPASIRRGQTIRFNLELGDPAEAVLLARGGFYQTTGGNWVFAVDPSGNSASKRTIRIGRQNPDYYEITDGLKPGDRVVTSSYETFGNADKLVFK